MKKLNILHTVEFYHPSVGGAQEVIKQLSEHLVSLGHNVTVATSKIADRKSNEINGVKINEFSISGNLVRGIVGTDLEIHRYQNLLKSREFDIILNYAAQQWTTDLTYQELREVKAKKILVPCGFSGLNDPDYADYFRKLPSYLKEYDKSVYLSNYYQDIEFARKHKIAHTCLIPNAADEREFTLIDEDEINCFRRKYNIKSEELLVLCVGNHSDRKGHYEAIEAFKKANIKKAILIIIGRGKKNCFKSCKRAASLSFFYKLTQNKRILSLNLNRDETIVAMKAADVFLHLSNIECSPLVLFEAAAAGTPFIASSAGNSEEIALWTGGGQVIKSYKIVDDYIIKPNINESSRQLSLLLNSKKLRTKLGENGRKEVLKKYTWAKIAKKYEELYFQLIGKNKNIDCKKNLKTMVNNV